MVSSSKLPLLFFDFLTLSPFSFPYLSLTPLEEAVFFDNHLEAFPIMIFCRENIQRFLSPSTMAL